MFGEPLPGLLTTPFVALFLSAAWTSAGVADGLASRYCAATPAACGAAIDVPLLDAVALSSVFHVEMMFSPVENRSTQAPMLE